MNFGVLLSLAVIVTLIFSITAFLYVQGQPKEEIRRMEPVMDVKNLKDMRIELERVRKVMWIGPHADDEVYVAGLLHYASLKGKDCIIVAYRAGGERRKLNLMSAELLGCNYTYLSSYPGRSVKEKIRSLLTSESPDLILTFHPETGFRMSEAHAKVGELVTGVISSGNYSIKLFYILNKDPTLEKLLGGADRSKQTHYLDLNLIVGNESLFEVKIADICVYSKAIPAAKAICEDAGGMQDRMLRYEFYEEYTPSDS